MRVLVACEVSGVIRDAFRARGHDAWSCDLSPSDSPYHITGDALEIARGMPVASAQYLAHVPWDLMICHPPCTYLASSGLHWNHRRPERAAQTEAAIAFALELWDAPIKRVCMENPQGRLGPVMRESRAHIRQTIQPYQFGEDASKATVLYLRGLPKLRPTAIVEPRIVNGKPRWANQTDSGQNKLGPSETRSADRARTYPGIARAMAEQWGAA